MGVTVTTAARSTRLARAENVQEDLGISTDTAMLNRMIDEASAAIVAYCHRPFAREAYTETLPGFGNIHLMLGRTPIVGTPTAVTRDSSAITDFSVADAVSWIERMKPARAILTNMHADLDYEVLRLSLPANVEPAYDGMRVAAGASE